MKTAPDYLAQALATQQAQHQALGYCPLPFDEPGTYLVLRETAEAAVALALADAETYKTNLVGALRRSPLPQAPKQWLICAPLAAPAAVPAGSTANAVATSARASSRAAQTALAALIATSTMPSMITVTTTGTAPRSRVSWKQALAHASPAGPRCGRP